MADFAPDIWLNGIRHDQNAYRKDLHIFTFGSHGTVRVAPMFHLAEADVEKYILDRDLPDNLDYFDPTKGEEHRELRPDDAPVNRRSPQNLALTAQSRCQLIKGVKSKVSLTSKMITIPPLSVVVQGRCPSSIGVRECFKFSSCRPETNQFAEA